MPAMKAELVTGEKGAADSMDVDSLALDELERRLYLLRELSANFTPDGNLTSVPDAKRLAKDLETVQKDLEAKRRRTSEPS